MHAVNVCMSLWSKSNFEHVFSSSAERRMSALIFKLTATRGPF